MESEQWKNEDINTKLVRYQTLNPFQTSVVAVEKKGALETIPFIFLLMFYQSMSY